VLKFKTKSYYDLANIHYRSDINLPKDSSFCVKALEDFKSADFESDALPINEDLNWEDMKRYILFRLWVACKRFPNLQKRINERLRAVVLDLHVEPSDVFYKQDSAPLIKCSVWHWSRGLLET